MLLPAGTKYLPDPRPARPARRWWFVAALIVVLGIAGTTGRGIFQRPLVRVGFNQFPPYLDKGPDGKPVGFAAEIFAQAARRAKVNIRWVEIDGSADRAFAEGKADMYPLMAITPDREALFHMSAPWWENQFALISTEGREIADATGAKGKVVATRIGVIQTLSQGLFPGAHFVDMKTVEEMEKALCDREIDGFFADVRLLEAQLFQRTTSCAGQALHAMSVPQSRLFLGTASTRAAASANDRIFREIAKLALDGTLYRAASKWGVFTPYDTGHLKQVVDAEARETAMGWALVAVLLVLALNVFQTIKVRRAKRDAGSAQAEAREMQDRFDEFMKHTPAITFIKDVQGRVVYSNEEFCCSPLPVLVAARTGGKPGLTTGKTGLVGAISQQLSQRDEEVLELGRGVEVTETLRDPDGMSRHFLVLKFPFRGAAGARFLGGVALDVTARIVAEKELEYHARNDLLTGLPNRRSFMQDLALALQRCQQHGERMAIGFVDLDGFKRVNDLMGHEVGDELLKNVAARLKQICRSSDMVARLGGDEFTFLLPGASPVVTQQIMTAVLRILEQPFGMGGKEIVISASIGVSLFPEHGGTSQQLLRNADAAMYIAKRKGKRRIEFWTDEQINEKAPEVQSGVATLAASYSPDQQCEPAAVNSS